MKIAIWIVSIFFFIQCTTGNKTKTEPAESVAPASDNFTVEKGINLSHWLSQRFGWSPYDKFIQKKDIEFIAESGFDHVRLPIDEENIWDEKGTIIPETYSLLKNCLDWCMEYNMRVIVDLHILRSYHFNFDNGEGKNLLFDDEKYQIEFVDFWKELSDSLKHYPVSHVAYEFLNEPNTPDNEDWNKLIRRVYDTIRPREPQRVFFFGANNWQIPQFMPYLKVPENDTNIILAFHTYEPTTLTHYKAYWNDLKNYTGKVQYPGVPITPEELEKYPYKNDTAFYTMIDKYNVYFDATTFDSLIKPAVDKSKELNLKLYCGEFGCLPSVPREMRLQYLTDITATFKKHNIGYAMWDFKGDFGVVSWDRENFVDKSVDTTLIQILVRK